MDGEGLTGTNTNEFIKREVLKYLYSKREQGMVSLNEIWKDNSQEKYIPNTLQALHTQRLIISIGHRIIGATLSRHRHTIDNTEVTAKITEDGIKHFREFYRDYWINHWSVKIGLFLASIAVATFIYKVMIWFFK
jgi:hypothetical protein